MSRIIRRENKGQPGSGLPLALVALGAMLVVAFVLALAWVWGGPRPQHDVAISLATTEVGA